MDVYTPCRASIMLASFLLFPHASSMAEERSRERAPSFSFMESWPGPSEAQTDMVLYELTCTKNAARLTITGYQTEMDMVVSIDSDGSAMEAVFLEGRSDDLGPTFKRGDVLFRLSRQNGQLWTEWKQLKPLLRENHAPGFHFRADGRTNPSTAKGCRL